MGSNLDRQSSDLAWSNAQQMAASLDADVLVYEYPGFGMTHSDGQLLKGRCCCMCCCSASCMQHRQGTCGGSEVAANAAIQAVFDFATGDGLRLPASQIVLLGSSLGTAFTIDLAASLPDDRQPGAVVLLGAMSSAINTSCSPFAARCLCCIDKLQSMDKVHRIKAPVLMVHGLCDSTCPFTEAHHLMKQMGAAAHARSLHDKYNWSDFICTGY